MEIGWIMGIFFVFVTIIFIGVAIFLPEWVGITGKQARAILEEHKEELSHSSASQNRKDDDPNSQ